MDATEVLTNIIPTNWGWVKWVFLLLGVITFWGVVLKQKLKWHITLQVLAFIGLVGIFAYGVWSRGALGSVGKVPHSNLYYFIVFVHVVCGGIYLLCAMTLFRIGPMALKNPAWMPLHSKLGKVATKALYVSVLLSLFLKV